MFLVREAFLDLTRTLVVSSNTTSQASFVQCQAREPPQCKKYRTRLGLVRPRITTIPSPLGCFARSNQEKNMCQKFDLLSKTRTKNTNSMYTRLLFGLGAQSSRPSRGHGRAANTWADRRRVRVYGAVYELDGPLFSKLFVFVIGTSLLISHVFSFLVPFREK